MAKIKYKIDSRGVLNATADVIVNGRLLRMSAQAATTNEGEKSDAGLWGQVTMDLFSKAETAKNGASEPKGVK